MILRGYMITKKLIRLRKRKVKKIEEFQVKRATVEQVIKLTKKIMIEYTEVFKKLANS